MPSTLDVPWITLCRVPWMHLHLGLPYAIPWITRILEYLMRSSLCRVPWVTYILEYLMPSTAEYLMRSILFVVLCFFCYLFKTTFIVNLLSAVSFWPQGHSMALVGLIRQSAYIEITYLCVYSFRSGQLFCYTQA